MHDRIFRLAEIRRRIERHIELEVTKTRPDRLELLRLSWLRQRARNALRRLQLRAIPA